MKTRFSIFILITLGLCLNSCQKDEAIDLEKNVEITIYPETGYGSSVLSDTWTQPLIFSDSDDNRQRLLVDIIFEGLNLDYERGYTYTLKAKKVWMNEPPMDVASIKYIFIKQLSKEKVITEDSEENLELFVSSTTVKFTPTFPNEFEDSGSSPKIYNALHTKKTGTNTWMALIEIEGFDYEEGYEYILTVRKITRANPYSVRYILEDIQSKTLKD